ncbi:MAG: sigma-70 family RNA polymerase sigma factor [Pseudomonadales bacterium]
MPEPVSTDSQALELARDRALARRMQRGDTGALAEFCSAYLPRVYRFALHRVDQPADADDVVQAVITSAARHIGTYRGEATLLAWLLAICRRELFRYGAAEVRRRALISSDQDDVFGALAARLAAPADDEPDAVAQRLELAAWVRERLDELPEHHARALELKYGEGLSSREIGSRLAMSDAAAQSLLARARRNFKEVCDARARDEADVTNGAG